MTDAIPKNITRRGPAGVAPLWTPAPGDSNHGSSSSNNNSEPPCYPECKNRNKSNQDRSTHDCVGAVEAGLASHTNILKDLLEILKMSQTYVDRDGKKGYGFNGSDPGKYDAFVTLYMDMVEWEAEETYNLRHKLMRDPEKR